MPVLPWRLGWCLHRCPGQIIRRAVTVGVGWRRAEGSSREIGVHGGIKDIHQAIVIGIARCASKAGDIRLQPRQRFRFRNRTVTVGVRIASQRLRFKQVTDAIVVAIEIAVICHAVTVSVTTLKSVGYGQISQNKVVRDEGAVAWPRCT